MRGNGRGEEEWRGDVKGMSEGMEGKENERPLYFCTKIQDISRKKTRRRLANELTNSVYSNA